MKRTFIASIATAAPPFSLDQAGSGRYLLQHYAGRLKPESLKLTEKLLSHPSIRKRHFAFKDPEAFLNEDIDGRIRQFTDWSIELSARALNQALEKAGLAKEMLSGLVVNTCTGYLCPGISTYLIEKLGLRNDIKVYDLVGSGCGGAIPNLEVTQAFVNNSSGGIFASVSVEICTATFQAGDDPSLLVSNAIFADGASAAILWDRPQGLELINSASCHAPEFREAIRYVHKNGQLHNQLSMKLPQLIKNPVAQTIKNVLAPHALKIEDIKHWALHSGGEKIINAVKQETGLSEKQLQATRKVLSEYGNMSSPTVWFVLDELLNAGIEKNDWCLMVAFGAGFSSHAFLLRMA